MNKADAQRLRNDVLDCTKYIKRYLDDDTEFFSPSFYPCFNDIGGKAKRLRDWIVNTNDEKTARVIAKIDMALWDRIQGIADWQCEAGLKLYQEFATVASELFEIHNWLLENAYNIPIEAIRDCIYYVEASTGKVKNRETQEEITKPLTDGGKPQSQIPPKELCTDKAVKIFEYAIKEGLMERNGNRYKWTKTNSLYGYFVDKVSDKLNLKSSANRIQWKLFERIVTNHKELLSTAKQAVNDYSNKNLPPPENDNIVNSILKHL